MKILVIDDEVKILRLLQFNLETDGHAIRALSNPVEALNLEAGELPDVIIMDLMMPDLDGFQLTQKLRENEATKDIPIIILSAKAQHGQILHTYKNFDINYYITKPFTMEQINKGLELVS